MNHDLVIGAPDSTLDGLDELADLWREMQTHQINVAVSDGLNRDLDEGWRQRRAWYEREVAAGGAIIRAHRGNALVGYCALSVQRGPDDTFAADGIVTVITLSVTEAERGRGIGTMLLDAARTFARSVPASVLALEVMPGNDRAAALYHREGFEPVEIRMHRSL